MTHISRSTFLDLTDVFAYVDDHRKAFIEQLIDYVRRPSISATAWGWMRWPSTSPG